MNKKGKAGSITKVMEKQPHLIDPVRSTITPITRGPIHDVPSSRMPSRDMIVELKPTGIICARMPLLRAGKGETKNPASTKRKYISHFSLIPKSMYRGMKFVIQHTVKVS